MVLVGDVLFYMIKKQTNKQNVSKTRKVVVETTSYIKWNEKPFVDGI